MKPLFRRRWRRGAALVVIAVVSLLLLAMSALAVDLGFLYSVEADLQATCDASALAAASALSISEDEVRARARQYAAKNRVNGEAVKLLDDDVEFGTWDSATRTFTPIVPSPSVRATAVRVRAELSQGRGTGVGLFFAPILGFGAADVSARSTAVFGTRDVMLAFDMSASMNNDSELSAVERLGKAAVEGIILGMYRDLGSPEYGNLTFDPVVISPTSTQQIIEALGLDTEPYPYPSGSWTEYVGFVQTDSGVASAGRRNHYGYLTLIDYWQRLRYKAAETPDLWRTREQPLTAVKDSVDLFLAYLSQCRTDDRVGLVVYNSSNGTAELEVSLTDDYEQVSAAARRKQAGHYHEYTNIAAGISKSREEMLTRGRHSALRLIVQLSDGKANWLGTYNPSAAKTAALAQAQAAAQEGIQIVTISLGSDADTELMQEIADITGGVHFVVPAGGSVEEYADELDAVFGQIAAHRRLRLVD